MLIPQDNKKTHDPSSPGVHSTSSPPPSEPAARRDSSPKVGPLLPPPYATSPSPSSVRSKSPGSASEPRAITARRFIASRWKLLGLLLVAAAITRLLSPPWICMGRRRAESEGGGNGPRESSAHDGSWDPSWDATTPLLPNETSPRQCDQFTTTHSSQSDTWSTHTTIPLPLHGELYFHGRGGHLSGLVEVSVGQLERKEGGSDEVLVKVEAVYRTKLEGWHVCRVGDDRVAGVVLVTPDRPPGWYSDQPRFHVQIDYPSSSSSHPTALPSLHLDTRNMDISTTDLAPSYTFSTIDYRTANGAITLNGLNTSSLRVTTSNAFINAKQLRGLTSTPTLHTSNGRIDCGDCCDPLSDRLPIAWDVSTSNAGVSGKFCATKEVVVRTTSGKIEGEFDAPSVRLGTGNANIKAVVSGLTEGGAEVTTTNGPIEVAFDVPEQSSSTERKPVTIPLKVSTTNGHLSAKLVSLPHDVALSARLRTSNSGLTWRGHPNYQGSFTFTTSPYVGGVSLDALKPLEGEAKRDLSLTEVGKQPWGGNPTSIRGTVSTSGKRKGDNGAGWGDIFGETSNGDMKIDV